MYYIIKVEIVNLGKVNENWGIVAINYLSKEYIECHISNVLEKLSLGHRINVVQPTCKPLDQ